MKNHPLERLSEQFLSEKILSASTINAYKIAYKHYIAYLKKHDILYAKTSDVIAYREYKRMLGHSVYYIYVHISALRGLYRYLRMNQKALNLPSTYAYDIMVPIKNERISTRIKKPILTAKEAKHLIQYTKENRHTIWDYRDHAIIYLMLTSGLRPVEIIHAKREDIKMVDGFTLLYIRIKESSEADNFVKLSIGAKKALDDYLDKRKDSHAYLFISHRQLSREGHLSRTFFKDMFPRVLKKCGLVEKHITPHCLRHTAAVFNLKRGASVETTRQLLRHVNIESTLVYVEHIEKLNDDSVHKIEAFILKEEANIIYMLHVMKLLK